MTTGTQGWHADPALLSSYLAGDLDAVTGASVEQHVSRCETCRTTVGSLLEPQLVERTWAGIRERRASDPALPDAARPAARALRADGGAARSAASLRGAWLVGAFLSLSFATFAAYASDGTALAPFLLAAPLAPVLGVAAAYGPRRTRSRRWSPPRRTGAPADPAAHDRGPGVGAAGHRAVGLAVPGPPWLAAAWLGPALALVPVLLALAGFVGPRPRRPSCRSCGPASCSARSRASRADLAGRGRTAGRLPRAGRRPPAPSSRSGPAPTGSRGWRL